MRYKGLYAQATVVDRQAQGKGEWNYNHLCHYFFFKISQKLHNGPFCDHTMALDGLLNFKKL